MRITVRTNVEFLRANSLDLAIKALNFSNTSFHFVSAKFDEEIGKNLIDPLEVMPKLKLEHGNGDGYDVFIVEQKFTDNYFSHEHEAASIISVDNWEIDFAPPPLHAYFAYQLVQAAAFFSAGLSWDAGNVTSHSESIGCCFDHCHNKPDIRFGLSAGMLCYSCEGALRSYNVSDEQIEALRLMLEQVRYFSIGRQRPMVEDAIFLVQRFSENDENANAMLHGVQPAICELGLRPIRGDFEKRTGLLINKITRSIAESSAVVAKVDEENLNVFFELGYAAALKKPVFLICEEGKIVDLPTDLKGWEMVAYKKGDYLGLKKEMIDHLSSIERFAPIDPT